MIKQYTANRKNKHSHKRGKSKRLKRWEFLVSVFMFNPYGTTGTIKLTYVPHVPYVPYTE